MTHINIRRIICTTRYVMPKSQLKWWPGGCVISRHPSVCWAQWKNRAIGSQSHLKVICTFIRILSIRPGAD